MSYPCACSSAMAAFSCGIDAEMFGSLMMFASGSVASPPSSASASPTCCASVSFCGKAARMRPASEMSRVSTSTPALPVTALMIGRNDAVARAGASSVYV